jgi:DNA-binding response OmpR family regulator
MFKLVIFSDQSLNFSSWNTWLERDFEITHISQVESLGPVLESLKPHVIIYSEKTLNPEIVARQLNQRKSHAPVGWVVIGHSYSLREELRCFESGVDHYLLFSTPVESVRARLVNLAQKSMKFSSENAAATLINLPTKKQELVVDELDLNLSNGVIKIHGEIRHVTPTQYRLVEALVAHTNTPLSREWIRENVFKNSTLSLRSIDAQVAKVKRSIPELRGHIVNLYGNGYLLKPPRQKISA